MLSIEKSDYLNEICRYVARGGKVTTYPPQENPVRVSAKPRIVDEEDNEEILNGVSLYANGGVFYKRSSKKDRE